MSCISDLDLSCYNPTTPALTTNDCGFPCYGLGCVYMQILAVTVVCTGESGPSVAFEQ